METGTAECGSLESGAVRTPGGPSVTPVRASPNAGVIEDKLNTIIDKLVHTLEAYPETPPTENVTGTRASDIEFMERLTLSSIALETDNPRESAPIPSPPPVPPVQSPFQKLHSASLGFFEKRDKNEAETVFDVLLMNAGASDLFLSFVSGSVYYNDFLFVLNVVDIEGKEVDGKHGNKNELATSIVAIFVTTDGQFPISLIVEDRNGVESFCSSYNCFQNYEMLLQLKLIVRLKLIKEAIPQFLAEKRGGYIKAIAAQAKKMAKNFQARSSRTDRLARQARKSAREALAVAKRKTLVIRNPRNLAVRRSGSPSYSKVSRCFQANRYNNSTRQSPFKSPSSGVVLSRDLTSADLVTQKSNPRKKRTTLDRRPEWNSGWNNKIHR